VNCENGKALLLTGMIFKNCDKKFSVTLIMLECRIRNISTADSGNVNALRTAAGFTRLLVFYPCICACVDCPVARQVGRPQEVELKPSRYQGCFLLQMIHW
jgi:hypothetical protein